MKKNQSRIINTVFYFLLISMSLQAQIDGSNLWFAQSQLHSHNHSLQPKSLVVTDMDGKLTLASNELLNGLNQLFQTSIKQKSRVSKGSVWLSLTNNSEVIQFIDPQELKALGEDGFIIKYIDEKKSVLITGNNQKAVLYGVFHYLRLLQTVAIDKDSLNITEIPKYKVRILNHWDNLDGSVERGYAGRSIWKWDELPTKVSPRYKKYARANASIGINGTVLNNVNANPHILTTEYLKKVMVIASELRPYGIQVYLSVNFASPAVLGGLDDANPKKEEVKDWWKNKVKEIYELIPDFGGFLVKANSEGQPGPMDYGCTHADGANMLADALKPYGGIVMWRAFVYNPKGWDRAKQAYEEFLPLDEQFRDNVMIQVKNGPVDFQPREPLSPMFGAMKETQVMPELQITQEYLGFSDHLVYLGTLYQEFLQSDTYAKGKGSTVAKVTDGSIYNHPVSGIAGVANIGEDNNWCGHHFAQANWYVFGRLAWNPDADVKTIAEEWVRQTLTQKDKVVSSIVEVMMNSREATVNYMTPLGLHHLMGWDHHYGPEPWCVVEGARPDWLPTYYHKADSIGIGFDRSSTGSNAVKQYFEPLRSEFDNIATCPEEYLLWFHHVPWNHKMENGQTLWNQLCLKYQEGVDEVKKSQEVWSKMKTYIDEQQFKEVQEKIAIQLKEAIWWKDACILYFQTFSKQPFPEGVEEPVHKLEELKKLKFDLKHHN
ncbi:alpha-glucuronidase family glycosyl hydrolase [Carboxylicivirga linearis]|nr:alpha-glucuronidase family glycosyl hydrolase [Carboxylicivirga linearis]